MGSGSRMFGLARQEAQLPVAWLTVAAFALVGERWLAHSVLPLSALLFLWLLAVILWGAFTVVRHADILADQLGEPFGTLILTLAVTVIEVSIIVAATIAHDGSPTLARDTVFAVAMLTLNGLVGLCLLLGGWRHHEQSYNLQGARAFLAVLMPLAFISLILPNFTTTTGGPTLSLLQSSLFAMLMLALYGVFLAIQTVRHRGFFHEPVAEDGAALPPEQGPAHHPGGSLWRHALLLVLAILPVVILAEYLAELGQRGMARIEAPAALSGVVVALLVLAPEGMGAIRAARANRLQRAVNITLGSALATIGMTMPAVLLIAALTGRQMVFGLPAEEMVLLALTLIVSILTFTGQRTNILQGAVHLVIFAVFAILIFDP